MNYQGILNLFDAIASVKGKAKHPLIIEALKSPDFLRVTQYILHPSKKFNVSKLKGMSEKTESQDLFNFLDYLAGKRGATAKDKAILQQIASESEAKFTITNKILRGKTDAGFTNKTMNKLSPGLIPYFPYMRCKGMSHIGKIKFPCFSQLKADQMYHEAIDGIFRTRNGNILDFSLVPSEHKPDSMGAKLMGECLLMTEAGEVSDRRDGNAVINKAQHSGLSPEEASRIRFVYWDIDRGQAHNLAYIDRLDMLKDSGAEVIECRVVANLEEAFEHYDEVRAKGLEGTILKNFDGLWKDGDSSDSIKAKATKECELEVIGIFPGKDKYEGMIGSLICKSSCGNLVTKIGMGLKEKRGDRTRTDWEGQNITVQFNEVSKSKEKDTYALSHGRLVEPRPDKNEADSLEYIMNIKEVKR